MMHITFDGKSYEGYVGVTDVVYQLPNGQLLEAGAELETWPPRAADLHVITEEDRRGRPIVKMALR